MAIFEKKYYDFALFVTGDSGHTQRIVDAVNLVLEEKAAGLYELRLVYVMLEPGLAKNVGVIATPTLVKMKPLPMVKIFGRLYDVEKIRTQLSFLDTDKRDQAQT